MIDMIRLHVLVISFRTQAFAWRAVSQPYISLQLWEINLALRICLEDLEAGVGEADTVTLRGVEPHTGYS